MSPRRCDRGFSANNLGRGKSGRDSDSDKEENDHKSKDINQLPESDHVQKVAANAQLIEEKKNELEAKSNANSVLQNHDTKGNKESNSPLVPKIDVREDIKNIQKDLSERKDILEKHVNENKASNERCDKLIMVL